eukprot:TRINITY_DN447_c0_g1_i1.p1 TRINITY_DN447_c0_g1~~TRINITY_DN447_c0_g1_i1.p1  ORF type:complete len:652 (+),score=83.08 TRINITY_DN447_c0_g1_i1:860-2815(+)
MSSNQEEQIQFIKNTFKNIFCTIHANKVVDQVCTFKSCENQKLLYCSKCLLEDEQHVNKHKIHFQSLDQFINTKITQISGMQFSQRLDYLKNQVNNLKSQLNSKITNIRNRINQDFSDILQNVQIYCSEIQKSLKCNVDQFERQQLKSLDKLLSQISQNDTQLNQEKSLILHEFVNILQNNFSFNNVKQVNTFIKKINDKVSKFSAEQFTLLSKEQVQEIEYDYTNNKYYNFDLVDAMKKDIFASFEEPIQKKAFINFQLMKNIEDLKKSTKQISVPIDLLEVEYNDKLAQLKSNYNQGCLAQKCILPTESKLSTNSLVIINNNTFVSSSNDEKIKLWQFSPNFIVNQFAFIETEGVCLNLRYNSLKKLLFAAMSNKIINIYSLQNLQEIKLHSQLAGHTRSVRCLTLIPGQDILASVSYDQSLKLWDINTGIAIGTEQFQDDIRILESNQQYIVLGCKTGFIQIMKIECIEPNEQGQKQVKFIKSSQQKISKERITAITLSQSQSANQICYIGSYNGTFTVFNLESMQIVRKIPNLHESSAISSINLFTGKDEFGYIVTSGWDKKINLIDLENYLVISNTKLTLSNDESKHWATDNCKLIPLGDDLYHLLLIGNNDKRVQIIELKFNYDPQQIKQKVELIVNNESQVIQK